VGITNVPCSIDGKLLVLVDDVLYTGRTIRAALCTLSGYGRPRAVWLAALVDRGWRELPIQPDFIAMACQTRREQTVEVRLSEMDGEDRVVLSTPD